MKFAHRTEWSNTLNPLSELLDKKRSNGARIINLTNSNPTTAGLGYLTGELLEPFQSPENLRYQPDPQGLETARQAICEYYFEKGLELEPRQIIITSSTSEAYLMLFRLLFDPGEHLIVGTPRYPLLDFLAELMDVELVQFRTSQESGPWRIDVLSIVQCLSASTRAVAVVNPNNPTGNYVTGEELLALNKICEEFDLALISDEVFFDYLIDRRLVNMPSLSANRSVLTFTLSGISKVLGLPQMKLGWIVVSGPEDRRNAALERLEIISDTLLSVSTPSQTALGNWLSQRQRIQSEILLRLRTNAEWLEQRLVGHDRLRVSVPEGGWYAILTTVGECDEDFSLKLLAEKDVLVSPGYLYEFASENQLVVSLLVPVDDLAAAINSIDELV